jgi:hypothetical protein
MIKKIGQLQFENLQQLTKADDELTREIGLLMYKNEKEPIIKQIREERRENRFQKKQKRFYENHQQL